MHTWRSKASPQWSHTILHFFSTLTNPILILASQRTKMQITKHQEFCRTCKAPKALNPYL